MAVACTKYLQRPPIGGTSLQSGGGGFRSLEQMTKTRSFCGSGQRPVSITGPGQVVYIRHEERPRYALVAVRSTAESPLRSDLLDATHGAAPFTSSVTSVYQAERTLFYLLTVIPGGGNLFVHLQRE
ncbi:hypothetical protein NHJ6243_008270 [Beauveria neobassiana]